MTLFGYIMLGFLMTKTVLGVGISGLFLFVQYSAFKMLMSIRYLEKLSGIPYEEFKRRLCNYEKQH